MKLTAKEIGENAKKNIILTSSKIEILIELIKRYGQQKEKKAFEKAFKLGIKFGSSKEKTYFEDEINRQYSNYSKLNPCE